MPAMCPVCRGVGFYGRLAPLAADSPDDPCTYCHGTGDDPREPQGESVKLFEPAPAQMPGQLDLSMPRWTDAEANAEVRAMIAGAREF